MVAILCVIVSGGLAGGRFTTQYLGKGCGFWFWKNVEHY